MAVSHAPRTAPARRRDRLRRHPWALPLTGSLLLAIALRAPYATVAMGPDEGGVAWVARQWSTGQGSLYGGQWLDRPPLLVTLYRLAEPGGVLGVRALGALAALAVVVGAFLLARSLAGDGAGRIAALLAAVLTGSAAIDAVLAPAELLAAVPAVASIAALVHAHRSGRARPLFLAGALAVTALLVKQSALDAGLAGTAFLVARSFGGAPGRLRAWAAYSAGAAAGLIPLGVWIVASGLRVRDVLDALIGFRAESLAVLQASDMPLFSRLDALALPAAGSLMIVLVPLAAAGLWRLRHDRVLAVVFGAWLAGGTVGILGGGSYWPHYLIQLVAPAAVGCALVLAGVQRRSRRVVLATVASAAVLAATAGGTYAATHPPRAADTAIAAYVRDHSRPGDSFHALYARANLNAAVGLPTPFEYSWSLMMRARPDARPRLLALLRSPARPTWVVAWQSPRRWGLDRDGAITRALRANYRTVDTVAGHRILVRVDRPVSPDPRTP